MTELYSRTLTASTCDAIKAAHTAGAAEVNEILALLAYCILVEANIGFASRIAPSDTKAQENTKPVR